MKKNPAVLIAFLSFIGLGIFDGMLGVAWPSIRGTFGVSLDALGALLLPAVAGYTLASSYSGRLVQRLGLGKLLVLAVALRMLAIAGQVLSPAWGWMIAAGLIVGISSGGLDAGLNTYVATNHSARNMNWMHAFYGVGATLGPFLATAILVAGFSWRWSYAAAAAYQLFLLILFIATRNVWSGAALAADTVESKRSAPLSQTLRQPIAWLGVLLFFIYTGTEVSTGQWSFTLFTEGRGIDPQVAGFWVGIYWGSFTVGRFAMGLIADRLASSTLLRASLAGTVVGLGLLWWNPLPLLGFLGLAFSGFAMAAIFPTLMADTPRRLGLRHAPNAIGLQVGAAGLGVGLLTSGVGVLAARFGLETIGALVVGLAVIMLLVYELIQLVSANRQPGLG